jgi:N4-gp56 family major capsid protein
MATTQKLNMINPEVLKDMIQAELPNAIRFAPLATVDNTLVGRPGDTVTVPRFNYIGDAADVAEGTAIDIALLTTDSDQFTIKKAGKGVELTDEAVLSGYGDPIGEGTRQLTLSIANKVDNDALAALATTSLAYTAGTAWNLDTVDNAIAIFNDEDPEAMVLLMNPKDALALRKNVANDWTRASELGDSIVVSGAFGEVLGAQVVRSNKLAEGTAYLVKRGALQIFMKRDVDVETDRDIVKKTTVVTADEHYGVHLFNESKAIKITVPTV